MPEIDDLVKEAANAYRAGRRQEARTKLMQAISLNEQHEQAWLWMSAVADSLEERQICLENVLTLNPANEQARKGLDAVNRQLAERGGSPSAPPSPPAPTPPAPAPEAPVSPFTEDFSAPSAPEEQGFDWFSDANSNAEPESFESATSVDWGNPTAPATYGSGQPVDLPSADEYDDWVQGLNLAGGEPAGGGEPAFDDMSFMVDAGTPAADSSFDPFVADNAPPADNQFGAFDGDALRRDAGAWDEEDANPFETETFLESPGADSAAPVSPQFGALEVDAADLVPADDYFADEDENPFGSAFMPEEYESDDEDVLVFETDDQPDDFAVSQPNDEFAQLRAAVGSAPAAASQNKLATDPQGYFRYIPAEIEAASSGLDRRSIMLLAGIVVMIVLNVLSFGALIL